MMKYKYYYVRVWEENILTNFFFVKKKVMKMPTSTMKRILAFRNVTWSCSRRSLSSGLAPELRQPDFGIVFDIDGVILRGKKVLPSAPFAFRKLVDDQVRTGANAINISGLLV